MFLDKSPSGNVLLAIGGFNTADYIDYTEQDCPVDCRHEGPHYGRPCGKRERRTALGSEFRIRLAWHALERTWRREAIARRFHSGLFHMVCHGHQTGSAPVKIVIRFKCQH